MNYQRKEWGMFSTEVEISAFKPENGKPEYHAMVRITDFTLDTAEQFKRIEKTIHALQEYLQGAVLVWKRYFVSDATNQHGFIESNADTAVSIVQQPPFNSQKVAVWLYFVPEVRLSKDELGGTIMENSSYRHIYHTQIHSRGADEKKQAETLFTKYIQLLKNQDCTLEKHCQRTWVLVKDIETQYADMAISRRACFEREGLTSDTHFIASTGIEGRYIFPDVQFFMDAYAVKGLAQEQVQYLYAPTHLSPTSHYGVTFERGVMIHYGDRRHIFISGTASINNSGEIEHPMDLMKQTERTFENMSTLLAEAGASITDIAYLIVYLRDISDYGRIESYVWEHYRHIPKVIVWAPVCRAGWLVEAECMAIKETEDERFNIF